MSNNDFLSGLAIGAVAVGVPLVTVGVCAAQRDRKLVRDVVDVMRNDPQKMLKGVEIAKSLTNMTNTAELRVAAKEFLREG